MLWDLLVLLVAEGPGKHIPSHPLFIVLSFLMVRGEHHTSTIPGITLNSVSPLAPRHHLTIAEAFHDIQVCVYRKDVLQVSRFLSQGFYHYRNIMVSNISMAKYIPSAFLRSYAAEFPVRPPFTVESRKTQVIVVHQYSLIPHSDGRLHHIALTHDRFPVGWSSNTKGIWLRFNPVPEWLTGVQGWAWENQHVVKNREVRWTENVCRRMGHTGIVRHLMEARHHGVGSEDEWVERLLAALRSSMIDTPGGAVTLASIYCPDGVRGRVEHVMEERWPRNLEWRKWLSRVYG